MKSVIHLNWKKCLSVQQVMGPESFLLLLRNPSPLNPVLQGFPSHPPLFSLPFLRSRRVDLHSPLLLSPPLPSERVGKIHHSLIFCCATPFSISFSGQK